MNRWKTLSAVITLSLLLASCQATTGRTAGRNVDDATLTASVNAALVSDKPSNFTRIDVDTTNGVVALNGTVESAEQRARAEQLASRVNGVKKVVNNLQVSKR
ncbi:MAG TPA: BON domain-containing protein [Candidatus Binatia bacterium]|jgi:hyperosmotically inducible protein|nr:BON domain-containing protein [Candidatus Binatia bacterium]